MTQEDHQARGVELFHQTQSMIKQLSDALASSIKDRDTLVRILRQNGKRTYRELGALLGISPAMAFYMVTQAEKRIKGGHRQGHEQPMETAGGTGP